MATAKTLKDLRRVPTEAIQGAITAIGDITWFYRHTHVGGGDIEGKSKYFEYAVDKFTTMAKNIQDKFRGITEVNYKAIRSIARACRTILNFYTFTLFFAKPIRIERMNSAIKSFTKTALYLKKGVEKFTIRDIEKTKFALKAMKRVVRFLNWNSMGRRQAKAAWRTVSLISNMAAAMLKISKIDSASITSVGDSLTSALSGVHAVDVGQVEAVTNMFNAFNGINKSENIINKFAESVKEFTATCKDLMDAMEHNTEAINGIETNNENGGSIFDRIKNKFNGFIGNDSYTTPATTNTDNQTNGIRIINVEELANTIAAKINGAISVDVPDTQVQLTINGSGGNEWIISKY